MTVIEEAERRIGQSPRGFQQQHLALRLGMGFNIYVNPDTRNSDLILTDDVRTRLMSLAPKVLFLGTRYLPAMLVRNMFNPIGQEAARMLADPDQAAAIAAKPAPWDCGRGAIIAVDAATFHGTGDHKMRGRGCLTCTDSAGEFDCGEAVISNHVVGIYWLDDLAPGVGVSEVIMEGPAKMHLLSYGQINDGHWHVRECEERGVPESEIMPLHDIYDWGAFGYIGRTNIMPWDEVYLLVEPGESDWDQGERDALHFLQPAA